MTSIAACGIWAPFQHKGEVGSEMLDLVGGDTYSNGGSRWAPSAASGGIPRAAADTRATDGSASFAPRR